MIDEDGKSRPAGGGSPDTFIPTDQSTEQLAFLNWLFGEQRDDRISICKFGPAQSEAFQDNEQAATYARHLDGQGARGTYFRLTTLPADWSPRKPGSRGDADESAYAYALAADLDLNGPGHVRKTNPYPETDADLARLLEKAGIPAPSAWLHSGGGRYPIWKFTERQLWSEVAELSSALHRHLIAWSKHLGWAMDNTNDGARVYRMPGTHNRKPDREDQPLAYVMSMDGPVYAVESLQAALASAPLAPAPISEPARPVSVPPFSSDHLFANPSDLGVDKTRKRTDYTDVTATTWLGEQVEELKRKLGGSEGVYRALSGFVLSCVRFEKNFPHWMTRELVIEEIAKAAKEVHGWESLDSNDMDKIERTFRRWDEGRVDDPWVAIRIVPAVGDKAEPSTWTRIDISHVLRGERKRVIPTLGRRQDGQRVIYAGKEHSVSSEPECGKTWWVLLQVLDILTEGGKVTYLDFEDDEDTIVGRLLDLGCPASLLEPEADNFRYARPEGPPPSGVIRQECTFGDRHGDLLVLDGVTEGMGAMGLDPLVQKDIVKWREVAKEAMRIGTAVLSTDHETKNKETRGRYAIGGQHKLAGLNGVMFKMESVQPFTAANGGRSKILISKDRNGALRNIALPEAEGMAHLGDLVCKEGRWTFFEPSDAKQKADDSSGYPSRYRDAVQKALPFLLGRQEEHLDTNQGLVVSHLAAKKAVVLEALDWMEGQKLILTVKGGHGAKLYQLTIKGLAEAAKWKRPGADETE